MKSLHPLLLFTFLLLAACAGNDPAADVSEEINAIENGLLLPIAVKGDSTQGMNIEERMAFHRVPGISIAVVEDGAVKWAKAYGIANTDTGQPVDVQTLFQAGSISKPVAALAALKLAEEGKVDLDEDVNTYLKGWQIPDSKFTAEEKVTLRRLLTHNAGMTVHGFPGYTQQDVFPSIISVLNGEGNTPAIFVDTLPGSIWRYSGGGYTVMEKVVEDVSGQPLEVYLAENILPQFGMTHSTYEQPLPEGRHGEASAAYDNQGELIDGLWHNYPEQAAAGLWTTPTDLANYIITVQEILAGKKEGALRKETLKAMLTKHKNDWGLGPSLMWDGDSLLFRHGGKNAGFTNEMIGTAYQGKGMIVMTNADNGGRLMGEIIRGISSYYDWGISQPREVELVSLSEEELASFAGRYKLNFQVAGIGDYWVDVNVKDGQLEVDDPNNGEINYLSPLEAMKFIDLTVGDEVLFSQSANQDTLGMLWNGRFQFYKVDETTAASTDE
ncbi:serine hydrolase domain-containing protein [Flavilitoribacter nigricans]|uniref:Serine hydrolase n=1 Tax=Flavilitoribacter nigricans (strain ATCC 23147 / DSM 23189 / NBRC 102662 / NCIMB 1420 / SS-2) TaxID=1122177 RepID=A0A2D0NJ27_FLAN2|nr:serine hydrolase domain-containing protein [Flavilitoribacter nigricans]PHN08199.1 serine hydrolase [Flavilitoribacter nigricans DSM 23189 = NBRC 102662]